MRRKSIDIAVEINRSKGKSLRVCYNKRKPMKPLLTYERVRASVVETLPFSHKDLGVCYENRYERVDEG